MQSVPIITNVVSSKPIHGEVYSIQHDVIKFVSDLRQVGPSWPRSSGSWDLQLPMQSVPITADVVSSNLDQGEVYNIM